MEYQIEIWKDVESYEGLYEVSNLQRVRSITRKGTKGKVMCATNNGKGYFRIKLCKLNKEKRIMLHRIIAIAFIDNPFLKKTVNHKNGIKTDNRIENLEWCTHKENTQHAIKNNLYRVNAKYSYNSLKVINIKTNQVYESIKEASLNEKMDRSYLADKLKGKIKNNTFLRLIN